ncbi:MAG: M16 family metallopeptidase [Bryobacteraceae bacterium]
MLLPLVLAGLIAAMPLAAQRQPRASKAVRTHQDLKFPPLREVRIPQVETATLPNGIRLYLLENHELPLISGFALVRTGNLFDPPDKIGLAGVTGTVLRSGGTESRTGDEIDEQLENIAAAVESSIGETSGSVSFSTLREHADEVLEVFRDVLTSPEFRQDKLDLVKTQMRGVISRRNDNPGGIASREFFERVYGHNPYGWRMEYEHVDRIQREDLLAFYNRYFFPDNVMLAVQGDFKAAEMKAKLEKLFAGWNVKQPPVPPFPELKTQPTPGIFVADKKDVTQSFFEIGHLGGTLRDDDYPALQVMGDILGGGFSSRLFRKVRTELGYAYSIRGSWSANYNHPGVFHISGSTKSASTTDTLKVIHEEVRRLRTQEVTDKELQTAKDTVLNSFVFNFDRPSKTLNRLVTYEYHGYPKDFIFTYQKAIAAVTKADVLRVAKEYLRPENFTIVTVGNVSEFGKPLTETGLAVKPIDLTIPEPPAAAAKPADSASLEKGRALLVRLQQAVGGAAKLAAVKDSSLSADIVVNTGQGQMNATQTSLWIAPSQLRQEQQLPFGKITVFFDGSGGWLHSPQGRMDLPPPVVRQVKGDIFRVPFSLWLSNQAEGRTVNYLEGGVLEISDNDGNSVSLTVDEATALPRLLTYRTASAGGPVEIEESYDDWREVDGIRLPHKRSVKQGGQPFSEVQIREWKLNIGLNVEELGKQP